MPAAGLVCCFAAWRFEGSVGIAVAAAVAAAVEAFAAAVAAEERRTVGVAEIAAGLWEVFVAAAAACCSARIAAEVEWRFEGFLAAEGEPAAADAVAEEAFVVAAARECLPAVSVLVVAAAVERTVAARETVAAAAAAVPF